MQENNKDLESVRFRAEKFVKIDTLQVVGCWLYLEMGLGGDSQHGIQMSSVIECCALADGTFHVQFQEVAYDCGDVTSKEVVGSTNAGDVGALHKVVAEWVG